ncbi:hypothetical protein HK102_006331, partial [Quaeritorhiza haematococci]
MSRDPQDPAAVSVLMTEIKTALLSQTTKDVLRLPLAAQLFSKMIRLAQHISPAAAAQLCWMPLTYHQKKPEIRPNAASSDANITD